MGLKRLLLSLRLMKKGLWSYAMAGALTVSIVLLNACSEDKSKPTDTLGKGHTQISVDETFKPVIENQVRVFESINPEAHLHISYKSESECYKDLFGDSVRLIIATRPPTEAELQIAEQKKIVIDAIPIAKDAIGIILNPANPDSVLAIAQLKGILTGTFSKKYTVVFDNQGSSTVRYIQDSLLQGVALGSNVYAAKTNPEVVEYVAKNKDAIGFVGLSYVSDTGDSVNESFLSKVKLAAIYNDKKKETFKPYQAYVALQDYPLTRVVYYISREHYPGLATGFANFISKERGQLIFSKFRLFPLKMNIVIREAEVNIN